ncbi:unnamed protein product [Linum tenue]|uniref:Carotenoid cleavage dioxygenase 4 n=2 Tax=Linum tenue TaxID=586396 RepID=A0AAV0JMB2_9ROSI|nr:unnamed protein product [Linum tenue]
MNAALYTTGTSSFTASATIPPITASIKSSGKSSRVHAAAANHHHQQECNYNSLRSLILNVADDFINTFIDPPSSHRPSTDPRFVLSGNFSPVVDELPPTECHVIHGSLPPCLDGAYIRNGPNPQHHPRGPYHFFDGDGMLHALTISRAHPPTLCSRYVKTYKYLTERAAGATLIPNIFSGFNGFPAAAARSILAAARILAGQFDPGNGIGVANTSLAFFDDRLFALGESDLPYAVRLTEDGDIETLGRHDFDGGLALTMTAHPKTDLQTGETFAFRYCPVQPYLTYFRFDAGVGGRKQPDVPIFSLSRPSLIHDFVITKKYAVFVDIQIAMQGPMEMVFGSGSPVGVDPKKTPRVGLIPRYAADDSEMRWFDVIGFNPFHSINAWDEEGGGDVVVLLATNIMSVEHALETSSEHIHGLVEKVRIDLNAGTVSRVPVSTRNLDFGVVNPGYVGRKNRFVYAGVGDPLPKISGVVKLDVGDEMGRGENTVACRMFGSGCFGGEPFFVAKNPKDTNGEEDDGYVVTYVHDEKNGASRFLVMDAQSPELEIVAAVKLPRRIPYGLHGLFLRESDVRRAGRP